MIRAPHGFGKTDLVSSWSESVRPGFHAVLQVPAPDDVVDADTFWNSLIDVARSIGIVAGEGITDPALAAAERVRDLLACSDAPILLVLPRIDLVDDDRLEDEIEHLLDRCHNVTVVATACARTLLGDPILMEPTHELVSARDLQYTLDDAAELFEYAGIDLGPGELEYIQQRVGALPELMRVAVAVAKSLPDVPGRRELLTHRLDTAIDRFVHDAVLGHPAVEGDRDFVTAVASARIVTAEVAALLTGVDDPACRLTRLERAGIVTYCETTVGDAWEFPGPVRERLLVLQDRAGLEPGRRLTTLAHHAADAGDAAGALSYAIEAQDWALVVELLEAHWIHLVGSHFGLLRATLRDLPDSLIAERPVIKAGRDLFLLLGTQPTIPADTLPSDPAAMEALGATDAARDALAVGCIQSLMLRLAGEHARAAATTRLLSHLVRGALAARPDDIGPGLPIMRLQWGITYQLAGAIAESAVELRLAHRGASGPHAPPSEGVNLVARNAAGNSALNWAIIGEPRRAEEWIDLEDAHPDPDGWLEPMVKVGGLAARVIVALDRLDFAAAGRWLDELGEAPDREELWPYVTYAHCRYALATGQAYTGMAVLQRAIASRAAVLRPGSVAARVLTTLDVNLRLALGEGNRAHSILDTQPLEYPLTVVTAARAHMLTGAPETALALCRTCDWFSYPFTRTQLEVLLVEAASHLALGERIAAVQAWTQATAIVDRTGLLGTLATVPRRVVVELDAAAPHRSSSAATFLASDAPEMYPPTVHRVGLTEREHAVLAALAQGLSTLEISREQFVSTNTVKSQQRSLYRKIGAHSRDEALEIAYRTGLLS